MATTEIGLEVNADKTKYMIMSRDQNAGRSHNMKIGNSSFERVEELIYLGTTLLNQNSIQEEIKSRLKPGNACYHSVQNLLPSSLLTKNLKIYRTIIFPVVLYGCETWLLTLWEEGRLRVSETRVLRRIYGPRTAEVTGEWSKLQVRHKSLITLCKSQSMRSRWITTICDLIRPRGKSLGVVTLTAAILWAAILDSGRTF